MNPTPLVITKVVTKDLCIGCGVCVYACPSQALNVTWNDSGFLIATTNSNTCNADGKCIKVCPFNPEPEAHIKNEDKIAELFLETTLKRHAKLGHYDSIYAGFSKKYRATSSSGGMATYIYDSLFTKGLIDHVITVGEWSKEDAHYGYCIVSRKDDLVATSKTRYYPVTLAHALEKIKSLEGKVAITGVACFIKAIRLAQINDPILKDKITFLTGIICGGVKSRFFTDYLASRAGAEQDSFIKPEYRVKDPISTSSDYGFSIKSKHNNKIHFIKMSKVGDMWGSGLFKANACDYCDDVTTELADVSLGDAWLEPYTHDGEGHNVVVARSTLVKKILLEGKSAGDLVLEELPLNRFLISQQGSFNHRHDGLGYRALLANKEGIKIPPKRHNSARLPFYLKLVQQARRNSRVKSLELWKKHFDATSFDQGMKPVLFRLWFFTKISHAARKLKRIFGINK